MSLQDPIADMFIRIKNAQAAKKTDVLMPSSKEKISIATVLLKEGFISHFEEAADGEVKKVLKIELRYHNGKPVIELLKRISKPSLRVYKQCKELPKVLGGLGVALISTSKGVVTDNEARKLGIGGEVICYVA